MNIQFLLAERPKGAPDAQTWQKVNNEIPVPEEGQVLVQNEYISLDPAMRGWMNDARSYIPPVQLGDVMRAVTVGKIIESKHEKYQTGEYLVGLGGVQKYFVINPEKLNRVMPNLAPLPTFLGMLGITGYTAYFGLLRIGEPKEGETVLVSAAAGAVGSVVGQIAKIKGCRVVGIAGGPEKCKYIVDELGMDAAIDYKNEDVGKAIRNHCPDGVDIYFDNVGGDMLDAALGNLSKRARVIICGAISQYNDMENRQGPKNYMALLIRRARMEGFVVSDYAAEFANAAMEMYPWIQSGKLKSRETIVEGIENFPDTFKRLFSGNKEGKLIIKV